MKVLDKMLSCYRHLRLNEEFTRGLDQYASTVPFIAWSTCNTVSSNAAVYEIVYDNW